MPSAGDRGADRPLEDRLPTKKSLEQASPQWTFRPLHSEYQFIAIAPRVRVRLSPTKTGTILSLFAGRRHRTNQAGFERTLREWDRPHSWLPQLKPSKG